MKPSFAEQIAAAQAEFAAKKHAEEVAKEASKPLVKRDNDTTLEALEAGASGVVAGGIGAVTAVPQLGLAAAESAANALGESDAATSIRTAREAISGRQLLDDAVSVAHQLALPDDEVEGAMQEWRARQRRLAEQYPTATAAGGIGGAIAGTLATGGLGVGGLGQAAAKGAGAVGAGRLVQGAAQGVAEGAAFGAASAADEAYIAERRLTGEQLLASAGVSGLLGGGLNFGLLGAGALIGKAGSAARSALGKVSNGGTMARAVAESNDAAIMKAAQGTLGEEIGAEVPTYTRELAAGKEVRPKIVSDATASLQSDLDTMMTRQDKLIDVVTRSKESNVAKGFAVEPPPEGAVAKAKLLAAEIRDELTMTRQELGAAEREAAIRGKAPPKVADSRASKVVGRLEYSTREIETWLAKAEKATTAAEAFDALDMARRRLTKQTVTIGKDVAKITGNSQAGEAAQTAWQNSYKAIREHLFDESTWGRQGAVQRNVNEAWSDYIQAKTNAFKDISKKVGERYFDESGATVPTYRILEGQVEGVVSSFGSAQGRDKLASMMQYVDATEKLGTAIGKGYAHNPTAAKAAQELADSALRIRKTIGEVAERTKSLRQAESLIRGDEGHATGIAGTMVTASGVLGQAPQAMLRLKLEQAATRMAKKIVTGVNWIGETGPKVQKAGGAASRVARAVAPSAMARLVGKHDSPHEAMAAMSERLDSAAMSQGAGVRSAVQKHLGAVGDVDPHATGSLAAAATRGVELLRAAMPRSDLPSDTPVTERKRAQAGRAETMAFADLVEAVDHPVDVLSRVGQGTVSSAQIDAIKQVYPELYEFTRSAAMRKLRKLDEEGKMVPFRQRASVDLLLGLDGAGERVLAGDFALNLGPHLSAPPAPPQPASSGDFDMPESGTDSMLGATA